MTLLAERLSAAGLRPAIIEFDRAIAQFLNNGGTIDEAQSRLNLARMKLSGGAGPGVPQGQVDCAQTRQPECSGETKAQMPQGQSAIVDPLLQIANEGHAVSADDKARGTVPPVREPSQAQRTTDVAIAKAAAISVFDKFLTRTGQAWGNVRPIDYAGFIYDAEIVRELELAHGRLNKADKMKPVRELLTPQQFYAVLRKAGAMKHAA